MKNTYLIIFTILISLFAISCEDVIELDLKDVEPRIIIEATLDATTSTAKVVLSESNGFYASTEQQFLSGAIITLSNSAGTTYSFIEITSGIYESNDIPAQEGEEMQLVVNYDNTNYTASSIVPTFVPLDSIEVSYITPPFGSDEDFIQIIAAWDDPEAEGNYYRIKTTRDDTVLNNNFNLTSDAISNGVLLKSVIRNRFEEGSSVTLDLLSVDKAYYDYFIDIDAILEGGFNSSSPFNPKGNFDNKALGYFTVLTSSKKSIDL